MARGRTIAILLVLTQGLLGTAVARAQAPDSEEDVKGWVLFTTLQGSANSLGKVIKFDTTTGYNFNRYVGVFGGVPVYFVRRSETLSSTGTRSVNGVGDAYLGVALDFRNRVLNYSTSLTGTAPTGNSDEGLSTGRATVDWNNHFDRSFGRLTPFANVGLANTVSDTRFFTRPFTTLGFVSHWDGGAEYRPVKYVGIGALGYAIVPSGEQKIFSRLRNRGTPPVGTPSRGRVFENNAVTIGGADLARDNGFSTWVALTPAKFLDLEVAYTRSIRFALDTISFTARINFTPLVRRMRGG